MAFLREKLQADPACSKGEGKVRFIYIAPWTWPAYSLGRIPSRRSRTLTVGGASRLAGGSCPPSRREKNYMCPLDPSRPLSQRKVYVKIHEMCQNTA